MTDKEILTEIIHGFNEAWIDYVNEGATDLFEYTRTDAQIEADLLKLNVEGLQQELMEIQVNDIVIDGDIAYIYDYERFRKVKDGVETFKEYNWVYTAKKVDGKWLLEGYEYDTSK